MLIRLVPSVPHATILYTLSFPTNLPDLPTPPAWSNQLHLLTSVFHLEPPQSIHVFDRSVGLVARVHDVTLDVPAKEVVVSFVDGRGVKLPMNSQCMQMLQAVVQDVEACTEQETRRDILEDAASASLCSSVASSQDIPSTSGIPHKSPKLTRHKKQRSLLFSLISSLVPRSLSPPPAPPPSPTTPRPPSPHPLPPIPPITPRNASIYPTPQSPYNPTFPPMTDPRILRRRARATLMDVWRRHVVSALSAHNPYAGYTEWVLRGYGSRVRSEVKDIERSMLRRDALVRRVARTHARTQSEGRVALDFGQRSSEETQRRWRPPSPFPTQGDDENDDCVVYPRNEPVYEWGTRHARNPSARDELDAYAFEFSGENGSLLRESFSHGADGDEWDNDDHVTFDDFGALGSGTEFAFDDGQLMFNEELGSDYFDEGNTTLAVTPSDATEEDDSDESQSSLRTPEDGEALPLPLPATLPGLSENDTCFQQRNHPDSVPTAVSKTTSSRPRTRPLHSSPERPSIMPLACSPSAKPSRPTPVVTSSYRSPESSQKFPARSPFSSPHPPKRKPISNMEELLSTRVALLSRIRSALTLARARAHEERWGSVRPNNPFGCGLLDPETERMLESRARRRVWSSGIKVCAVFASAVIPAAVQGARVWDGSNPAVANSPNGPPGLSAPVPKVNGPIIPTGLSLGKPVRRSPLAMYVWSTDDMINQETGRYGKYGAIGVMPGGETAGFRRPMRVSFLESPTKLFPVREEGDDEQGSLDRNNNSKINFPQSPTSPTSPAGLPEEGLCVSEGDAAATEDESEDDPFFYSVCHARTRTRSMYAHSAGSQTAPSSHVLPMFRPRTPPPSYQAAVGEGGANTEENPETGALDTSALLFQPLSKFRSTPSTPITPTRPLLVSNPPFTPRARSLSLPTSRSRSRSSSLSSRSKDEDCQDLSQAYAAPPPRAIPITIEPTIAVNEPYLTYAHLHAPVPICGKGSVGKGVSEKSNEIASKEVIFERNGKEYTLGLEVALGRAEEGRSVW